ncbi:MAG TPA: alpha/beta fold hydrolase [Rubrivivax sp.]|nr:alpha/beta fold hydrolase [Rubrivivax sp.]
MNDTTVLIVPGLRDAVALHWQTLLEAKLRAQGRPVVALTPPGREDLQCAARVAAIDDAVRAIDAAVVIVAHSAGCVMVAHWAQKMRRRIRGALLAAPADFELPMPTGYPTTEQLRAGGWLPVPRTRLPFRSIVAASSNDPLGDHDRIVELAEAWGSERVDLGAVGHLNPASGYGEWPRAEAFIDALSTARALA